MHKPKWVSREQTYKNLRPRKKQKEQEDSRSPKLISGGKHS